MDVKAKTLKATLRDSPPNEKDQILCLLGYRGLCWGKILQKKPSLLRLEAVLEMGQQRRVSMEILLLCFDKR